MKIFTIPCALDIHSYKGKPKGKNLGLHAMILIGCRTKETKKYFLLQNWWKKKQFVEVDEEYLEECSPTLFYVKTPQESIPKKFPTNFAKFAENENLDKQETFAQNEGPLAGIYN